MNEIEQLLQQDMAKIILAIMILIGILIVVIIIANLSSRKKKAELDNTRILHKEEFEKASKKRMELTQTISRDAIKTELEKPLVNSIKSNDLEKTIVSKKNKVDEKTRELNLESVRRKLLQDEKLEKKADNKGLKNSLEPRSDIVSVESNDGIQLKPEIPSPENVESSLIVNKNEDLITDEIFNEENFPINNLEIEKPFDNFNLKEEKIVLNDLEEYDADDPVINVVETSDVVGETEVENFEENTNVFSGINLDFSDDADIWDEDFIAEVNDLEGNDNIDDEINRRLLAIEEGIFAKDFDLGFVEFDENDIVNDTTTKFLDVESISSSVEELNKLENIEFVDVLDQSVYVNSFVFGENFSNEDNIEFDDGMVIFDFSLSSQESIANVADGKVVFGLFSTENYTYYEDKISQIFDNNISDVELMDLVDSNVKKAVVVNEELIVADYVTNLDSIDLEEEILEVDPTNDVYDGIIIEEKKTNPSIEIEDLKQEELVIDISSQLDKLGSYEMNLLEEFDFAEKDYNYNFNSINVMEEIVEDMFLDDFVESEDDEYFKYVYQFALLDDAIDPKHVNVNFDNVGLEYNIVDDIDGHLKVLSKTLDETKEVVEVIEKEEEIEVVDDINSVFKIDDELLQLSTQVLQNLNEEKVEDTVYAKHTNFSNVISPIYGGKDEFAEVSKVKELESSNEVMEELSSENDVEPKDEFNLDDDTVSDDVNDFVKMINDKINNENIEHEEEFLDILKSLIK
ncbi:MAG: hypothetical protein ACK5NF_06745 [Bacilli bacterium]